ncbi:DUF6660 family protein [Spirosoma sp. KNUC1025]|uniref:DUF6660 family protein n=1 Tax=Spirosoma sp. KNUC1025 TaxID=2894082 RepID=UPI0038643F92|nr:hypothetical protein LN737_11315 [Spirosoma sp. KNUC1025]
MKFTVFLLSLWLLLLTGLPCPDADCHTTSTVMTHSSQSDEHDHGHKAPCSPFCHCATCFGFSIPRLFNYASSSEPVALISSEQVFDYQSPDQADIADSIWQPPKL